MRPAIYSGKKAIVEPDTPDDPYCLDRPAGMAIGPDGNLYVADTWHGRIKKFDPDGNSLGVYLLTDDAIMDVAFDSQGLMYISQHYNGRISMYRFDDGTPVLGEKFPLRVLQQHHHPGRPGQPVYHHLSGPHDQGGPERRRAPQPGQQRQGRRRILQARAPD